jgi:hypothetical protein
MRKYKGKPRGRPRSGVAMTAAERMRRMRARRKLAGFKVVSSWVPSAPNARSSYSSHRVLEARSLAMHAIIARKIERDPSLLDIARRNLDQWSARRKGDVPAWFHEWRQILGQPWPDVAALITELSDKAARLRQSSPFAGVLTVDERNRIYAAFRI